MLFSVYLFTNFRDKDIQTKYSVTCLNQPSWGHSFTKKKMFHKIVTSISSTKGTNMISCVLQLSQNITIIYGLKDINRKKEEKKTATNTYKYMNIKIFPAIKQNIKISNT